MRLYVGIIAAEQGLGPFDGEDLDGVSEFDAAVVAPMGVSLNGLVDQHRTQRIQAGLANHILRGNQLNAVTLAGQLATNRRVNFWISGFKTPGEIG